MMMEEVSIRQNSLLAGWNNGLACVLVLSRNVICPFSITHRPRKVVPLNGGAS